MNKKQSDMILSRIQLPSKEVGCLLYYNYNYKLENLFSDCEVIREDVTGGGDETSQYVLWKLNKFGEAKVDMYVSYGQVIGSCNYCSCNKNTTLLKQLEEHMWRACFTDSLETAARDYMSKIRSYWDIEQWEINEIRKELESTTDLNLQDKPLFTN